MPLIHPCASEDCNTLTMGVFCRDCEERANAGAEAHDLEPSLAFVLQRGVASRPSVARISRDPA